MSKSDTKTHEEAAKLDSGEQTTAETGGTPTPGLPMHKAGIIDTNIDVAHGAVPAIDNPAFTVLAEETSLKGRHAAPTPVADTDAAAAGDTDEVEVDDEGEPVGMRRGDDPADFTVTQVNDYLAKVANGDAEGGGRERRRVLNREAHTDGHARSGILDGPHGDKE